MPEFEKRKKTRIQISVAEADLAIWRKAAEAANMSVPQYILTVMAHKTGSSRPNYDEPEIIVAGTRDQLQGAKIVPREGESPEETAEAQRILDMMIERGTE